MCLATQCCEEFLPADMIEAYIISNARTLDPILSLRLLICTRQEVLKHVLRLTAPSCLHLWFNLLAELFRGRHLRFPISAHQRPAATSVCACVINYSRVARRIRTHRGYRAGFYGKTNFLARSGCGSLRNEDPPVCVRVCRCSDGRRLRAEQKYVAENCYLGNFRTPCVLAKE